MIEVTVISGPGLNVKPVVKLVPRTMSDRVVVCGPFVGLMLVIVGVGPGITLKSSEPLTPPDVVTVTVRFPRVVSGEIVNLAVAVVEF